MIHFQSVLAALLIIASSAVYANEVAGFITPKNGDSVSNPIKIVFSVTGMAVKPAGTIEDKTGHHHLIIDGMCVAKGESIPFDAQHMHFGKGQTEAEITLPSGPHTLTMQFADGAHRSYGKSLCNTIKVNVR